ncbi:MAG: metal-dependent hydrolase [Bacteroidota bacterium]
MDSLTQIVLGAATGEVVLGRKAGNRAMLFGAVAGTIPDLDILANLFCDDMTALAFHRGISHSFFFAVTAPMAFAWLTHKMYDSGIYLRRGFRMGALISWILLAALIAFGLNMIPVMTAGSPSTGFLAGSVLALGGLGWWLHRVYLKRPVSEVDLQWKDWYWLYFWAILTHPLLDCCTAYGTQVFQPFSDYRVAWNNISVADPIYTFPFLICVIIAARFTREHRLRRVFNYVGIGLSCLYMAYTVYNKFKVNAAFEKTLANKQIDYQRYMTSPTIFNNLLWHCIAEGDSVYYQGLYSVLDKRPDIDKIRIVPKNRYFLKGHATDEDIKTLEWFSNGYYNVIKRPDGKLQFNDLRYGFVGDREPTADDFVFRFILVTDGESGEFKALEDRNRNFKEEDLQAFRQRMMGVE